MPPIRRLAASIIAAIAGWAAGNMVTSSLIMLLDSPGWEWRQWAMLTGPLSLAAWVVVGIPLVLSGARFASGRARAKAVLITGLGACGYMALLVAWAFRPLDVTSASGRMFLLINFGQALMTGSISMLVYCLLSTVPVRRGKPLT